MTEPVPRSECRDIHKNLSDDNREDMTLLHNKLDKVKACIDSKFATIATWMILVLVAVIGSLVAAIVR